jgi:tetrahydromethanopterin S-methyltransferase subunit B
MAVEKNVLRYYIRSDGTFFSPMENSGKIYPGSTYANLLDIYLEDGISENTFVQVNFLIDGKFVTEWLPTFNQGTETRVIANVSVPFTGFRLAIPPNVTQNASPTSTKQIGISVRQVYGDAWQGVYTDYSTLNSEVPPTAELTDDYATAYVLETEDEYADGFYQCQYDNVAEEDVWKLVTIANTYQEIKTYGVGNATLQMGWVSPKGTVKISDITSDALYLELSNIEQRVTTLEISVDELDVDKLDKDFSVLDPKTTYNDGDSIAINDDEDSGDPKEMTLGDLMEAENMSFDNTATDLEATTVQDVVEELESDIIAVDEKVDLHIADETNPHNVTATQVDFTPTVTISSDKVQEAVEEVQTNLDDYETSNNARVGDVEDDISDILDGTQTVKKAERDSLDNVIKDTYATKTENNAKVSKVLTGYSATTSLSDSNRMYVDDSGTPKYTTIGTLKTYIAGDFVSFGYVIESDDGTGLPDVAEPLTNKIYLVATGDEEEDNIYNEFIYVEGEWELFGTTQMEMTAENITYDGSTVEAELNDIKSALLTLLGE